MSKRIAFVVNALSGSELKAGASDSARVFQVLVDPSLGGCDAGSAKLIRDCPDRDTFNRSLLEVLDGWDTVDQLILYFSGHGEERQGLYHLCFGAENRRYFPFKNILTELASSGVCRAIIILDSCQSGAALRKGEKSSPQKPIVSDDEISRGVAIITSCRANENSHEKDDQTQSVFTGLFCDAITSGLSGSPTPDGTISVSDLVSWVNKTLQTDPKLSGFSQTSKYGIDGAEHHIWIALNKSGKTTTLTAKAKSSEEIHHSTHKPTDFDKWLTSETAFSPELVKAFRQKLRPDIRSDMLPDDLDEPTFIFKANLSDKGFLYASGVVLFTHQPEQLIPSAYLQCFLYRGVDRSTAQEQKEIYGPLMNQLSAAMTFIESRIEKAEITPHGRIEATFEFQYPMTCVRELLANALCHRDYLDGARHTAVRIFSDRIEIASPGLWGSKTVEAEKVIDLASLAAELSAAKNQRLATAFRRIKLVETGGSGIPNALADCKEQGAKPPTALSKDGVVTITIYPRTDWSTTKFDRRGTPPFSPKRVQNPVGERRFRIAFSFAGEKRSFVEKVAVIFARQFGEAGVLYDKFHEAEFARANFEDYLPRLYDESDLVVVVVDPSYEKRAWTNMEWAIIRDLLKQRRRGNEVLLSRFDRASVNELSSGSGFIELDNKTPEQFATLILERLALNEGKPKDYYAKASLSLPRPPSLSSFPNLRTDIPHNLPTLQPFFGREHELRKIADALDPDSRTWGVLIDGPGGMGKTSLAVRAAYDASPDAFKKIIFISLKTREFDDDGVRDLSGFILSGLAELLNELTRELGRDDIAKAPEDQRPRLLLDALRGTQTLLVLDNLESLVKRERDSLFTFIKKLPLGCKAILTSRGRIGSGAEELILEKLSEEAALATLAELAIHNPHLAQTSEAERRVLYRETGGKPLLLRWAAGQFGRGHCLTFTDALKFIRSCPPENDPLEFIFGDLVEDFSEAETRALCSLAYFNVPASVEHVAAIAELPVSETDRVLRILTNRSLAVPMDELKTFTLVTMVAEFLRRRRPGVMASIGDRLEKHAYALIIENGYDKHNHFPALEAAWPGITPAFPLFLAGDNARLQTVCDALHRFLEFQGRWDEWLALSEKAEFRAVSAADHLQAGWRASHIGYIHYLRQQAEAVLTCAERAAAHWDRAKAGARERGIAIRLRGMGHQLTAEYPAAIATYREALELHRSLAAESRDVASDLNSLAEVERLSGDLVAAEGHYREALRVARVIGHIDGVANFTGNLAELALAREDWTTAETLAREALSLAESIHRQELIARSNHRVAQALVRQGKAAEALPHARLAVEIYTRLGSPDLTLASETLRECES